MRKAMLRVIHPCVSVFWWRKRHTGVASQFQGYSYSYSYSYSYIWIWIGWEAGMKSVFRDRNGVELTLLTQDSSSSSSSQIRFWHIAEGGDHEKVRWSSHLWFVGWGFFFSRDRSQLFDRKSYGEWMNGERKDKLNGSCRAMTASTKRRNLKQLLYSKRFTSFFLIHKETYRILLNS